MDAIVTRRQRNAAAKAAQRKRRKAGLEEVRVLVNMPKLTHWLVAHGWVKGEDTSKPAIRIGLEDFLRAQYEHSDLPDTLDKVGLLEREATGWRDRPTTFLIKRNSALLRKLVPPPEESDSERRLDGAVRHEDFGQPSARLPVEPTKGWPPPYQVPQYDYAEEAPEPPPDDYDPEGESWKNRPQICRTTPLRTTLTVRAMKGTEFCPVDTISKYING